METSTNRSDVIAVETHSSPLWGLIILLAVLGPAVSVALVPSAPARAALAVVAVIGSGRIRYGVERIPLSLSAARG